MTSTQFRDWLREKNHETVIMCSEDFAQVWAWVVPSARGKDEKGYYANFNGYVIRSNAQPPDPTPIDVSAQRIIV